jgi:hypothetical protein
LDHRRDEDARIVLATPLPRAGGRRPDLVERMLDAGALVDTLETVSWSTLSVLRGRIASVRVADANIVDCRLR